MARVPTVDVIVAVVDEVELIAGKLANLAEIDYPAECLRFLVVDGGSRDGTCDILAAWAARESRAVLLTSPAADKTAQLNLALAASTADWVLVSDADARVPPGALRSMIEMGASTGAPAVGALAVPRGGHALEALHWRLSNRLRRAEWSVLGTTGLVVATCYLFRRELIDHLPADCVADDVHVALRAAAGGHRVALANIPVEELRVASSVSAFARVKFRRTQAYLREVFRFLRGVPALPLPMRQSFVWRAAMLFGMPFVLLLAALVAVGAHSTSPEIMVVGVLTASVLAYAWRTPATMVLYGTIVAGILGCALLLYPFARQTTGYQKRDSS